MIRYQQEGRTSPQSQGQRRVHEHSRAFGALTADDRRSLAVEANQVKRQRVGDRPENKRDSSGLSLMIIGRNAGWVEAQSDIAKTGKHTVLGEDRFTDAEVEAMSR